MMIHVIGRATCDIQSCAIALACVESKLCCVRNTSSACIQRSHKPSQRKARCRRGLSWGGGVNFMGAVYAARQAGRIGRDLSTRPAIVPKGS